MHDLMTLVFAALAAGCSASPCLADSASTPQDPSSRSAQMSRPQRTFTLSDEFSVSGLMAAAPQGRPQISGFDILKANATSATSSVQDLSNRSAQMARPQRTFTLSDEFFRIGAHGGGAAKRAANLRLRHPQGERNVGHLVRSGSLRQKRADGASAEDLYALRRIFGIGAHGGGAARKAANLRLRHPQGERNVGHLVRSGSLKQKRADGASAEDLYALRRIFGIGAHGGGAARKAANLRLRHPQGERNVGHLVRSGSLKQKRADGASAEAPLAVLR